MSSVFGKYFTITTWGESHGTAIGAVIDGCPSGLGLDCADIQTDLDRRKPGNPDLPYTSPRKENDIVQILSGVFEGKTTGTSISLLIPNTDQRPKDYENLKD
ncbi:MAG: chorismate synthase, partial [Defluviitaleaceae bacterium]|nr:chorismate synthase [Defluviitaleaceae bacterium]